MPVAKTYVACEIQGEQYRENGKWYINVVTKKGIKKVRWYSDAEYRRMYPNEVKENDVMDFNARHAFGFGDLGYITIYKGNQDAIGEFVERNHEYFRYNLTFGYYTPSRISLCALPNGITPVRLNWEEVMDHDDHMKPHADVREIVEKLIYEESASKFQGVVNDWITKEISIRAKKTDETRFGAKHSYTLADAENNIYVWQTGAKDYQSGQTVSLKMKVKEHKVINGENVTIVWYCKESA